MVDFAITLSIMGPAAALVLFLTGAVKMWPYLKIDKEKARAIYKPYRIAGFAIWLGLTFVSIIILYTQ